MIVWIKMNKPLFEKLKELDLKFWSQPCQYSKIQEGCNRDNFNFYGEIFFLLIRKKQCVLFSGVYDSSVMRAYQEQVLESSGLFEHFPNLTLKQITNPVFSDNESEYCGLYLLFYGKGDDTMDVGSSNTFESPAVPFELLFGRRSSKTADQSPSSFWVSEETLSQMFGYPVALPEKEELKHILESEPESYMCEVAYLDVVDAEKPIVVTTFGIRRRVEDITALKKHFKQWQKASAEYFPLDMELTVL